MTSHMILFRATLSKTDALPRQSSWKDRRTELKRSLPATVKAIINSKRG